MSLPATFRANLGAALNADPRPRKAIASVSGYSESYIRRVTTGSKPNPTLSFVECMADTLGLDPIALLREK